MGNNGREVIATEPNRQALMQQSRSLRAPIVVRAFLLLSLLCPALLQANAAGKPLGYDRTQSLTTLDIIERLGRHHYARVDVDDALSERLLENYLKNLDPGRNVFLGSDIEEFRKLRHQLDDQLLAGDVSAGFAIYDRYRERMDARLGRVTKDLHATIQAMDFSTDEVLLTDRDKLDWPADEQAADELWHKQLKSSVLGLKLAGKKMDAIEELLEKRYKDQLRRMTQVNSEDVYQLYMNSFTELFDPHTNYLSPRSSENFNMNMRLSLEGIGAVLQQDDEFTKVARLVPAGPAAKQGQLRQSDRIVAVGQGEAGEMVDVVGWRLDDVVDLIRGKKAARCASRSCAAAAPARSTTSSASCATRSSSRSRPRRAACWRFAVRGPDAQDRRDRHPGLLCRFRGHAARRPELPQHHARRGETARRAAGAAGRRRDHRSARERRRLAAGSQRAHRPLHRVGPDGADPPQQRARRAQAEVPRRQLLRRSAAGADQPPERLGLGDLRRRHPGLRARAGGRLALLRQGHGAVAEPAEPRPAQDDRVEVLPHLGREHAASRRGAGHRAARRSTT